MHFTQRISVFAAHFYLKPIWLLEKKKSITEKETCLLYFRLNDIEKATNAKYQIEQRQREQAKVRKETSEEWDNLVRSCHT